MKLNPYLTFNGQCKEAFTFYQEVLGGEIAAMMTYAETPMADQTPPEMRGKIIHARLLFGDNVLMASDAHDAYEPVKGISVALNIEDVSEAERVCHALAAGGSTTMPFQETFWAKGFGMLTDRFGTPWMINCEQQPG